MAEALHNPQSKRTALAAFFITWACAATAHPAAMQAFADHCFSPYLTAEKAREAIAPSGARVDFYDLRPFSSAAPSPVIGRAATPATDRRCEVAFDGQAPALAAEWIRKGIAQEGLAGRLVSVPDTFPIYEGTTFKAAAQLNPNRIAVVQAGLRQGPNGIETFMNVERLTPLDGS